MLFHKRNHFYLLERQKHQNRSKLCYKMFQNGVKISIIKIFDIFKITKDTFNHFFQPERFLFFILLAQ